MEEHSKSPSEHTNARGMQGGNGNSPTVFLSYHHSVEIFYDVNHYCGQNRLPSVCSSLQKLSPARGRLSPAQQEGSAIQLRSPAETRSSEPKPAVLTLLCFCSQALVTDQTRPFSPRSSELREEGSVLPTQQRARVAALHHTGQQPLEGFQMHQEAETCGRSPI